MKTQISLAELLAAVGVVAVAGVTWFGASRANLTAGYGIDAILFGVTIAACLFACHHYGWKRPVVMLLTIPLAVVVGIVAAIQLVLLGALGAVIGVVLFVGWFGYLAWASDRRTVK